MNSCETCRYAGETEKMCKLSGGMPKYLDEGSCPLYAMSGRAFMTRVLNAQRRIENLQKQADRYRALAVYARKNQSVLREKKGVSAEAGVDALEDVCRAMEAQAQALRLTLAQAMDVISRINDPMMREILELHYLMDMKFAQIALRMKYDERQVRRNHVHALALVQREMDRMGLSGMKHPLSYSPQGGAQGAVPVQ